MSSKTKIIKNALCSIFEYTGTNMRYIDDTALEAILKGCIDRVNELPGNSTPIPEPDGGNRLLNEILQILKEGPQTSFDIYLDIKDSHYDAGHIEIALKKLIDDRKVEKVVGKYQLKAIIKEK